MGKIKSLNSSHEYVLKNQIIFCMRLLEDPFGLLNHSLYISLCHLALLHLHVVTLFVCLFVCLFVV